MSQAWPTDRKFVDKDGKIVDPWMGPLQQLKPLLKLTPADFVTLQAIILAAQDAEEGESAFALPIDTAPIFSTDYAVGFDTSEGAGRRYPLTLFKGAPVLISTTNLSGNADVSIAVPGGFKDLLILGKGVSGSASSSHRARLSEDGGTTFLTANFHTFNASNTNAGASNDPDWAGVTLVAANTMYSRMTVFDYGSGESKYVEDTGIDITTPVAWMGVRLFTSTAPINLVKLAVSTGTFDAGTVELWGMP
jgi:hypothetical protein